MITYVTYPELDTRMREAQATNISLAAAAGVAVKTVSTLRSGGLVRSSLVECVEEALLTKRFAYLKKGPKGPNKNPTIKRKLNKL